MLEKILKYLHYLWADLTTKKKPLDKNLWLISERGFDAQDNGYHLYKHILEHPELNIRPVYLINEDSPDYEKIAELGGDICEPNTVKHYELMYQAGALVSTHTYGFTPDMTVYHNLAKHHLFKPKGVNVFLQHGINDKDTPWLYRDNYKPDLFVISSDIEKRTMGYMYHQPKGVVADVGLCRYDKLNDAKTSEKIILIMPTWRVWLNDLSEMEFLESEFCKRWRLLLFDKSFIFNVSKQGYKVIFYLHPELQKYKKLFEHDGVEIASENLQPIMMNAELLVTDYSSVYFDMSYMNRNIIFWQFDRKRYITEHYKGLLVDHSNFGYMAADKDDVQRAILNYISKGKTYGDKEYINNFFLHHDSKNCERTIQIIRKKQGE